jgi:hypothetical protein
MKGEIMERSLSDLSSSEWLERAPFYYTKSKNRKEGEAAS